MSATWKTVRVFISSTFRDMHAERDHLVKVTFPRLRQWCEERRLHLVDIDLRWGVTEQEANNGKAIEICLQEIDGSRPFFLCILGNRYGWVPDDLPAEERYRFRGLQQETGLSITHLEILHAAMKPLPRIDGSLKEVCEQAFFYFREPECLPSPETLANAGGRSMYATTFFELDPVRRQMLVNLKDDIRQRFYGQDRVFDYKGTWDPAAENPEDDKLIGRLTDLDTFGDRVEADLKRGVEARFAQHLASLSQPPDPLAEERSAHEAFIENRTQIYVPRPDVEGWISQYVDGNDPRPLVLSGPPGGGKSAILAHWVKSRQVRAEEREFYSVPTMYSTAAHEYVIARFIGASPGSTSLPRLLGNICQELVAHFAATEEIVEESEVAPGQKEKKTRVQSMEVPADPAMLLRKWPRFLEAAGAKGRIILVLDALNQLDRSADSYWLPRKLPAGVRLVISVLDHGLRSQPDHRPAAGEQMDWLSVLRRLECAERPIPNLTEEQRRQIIHQLPSVFCKTLDAGQVAKLLSNPATQNPLFLTVALEELRVFGSFEKITAEIESLPSLAAGKGEDGIESALDAMFGRVLARLERESPRQSPLLVPTLFALLASAKEGLSEEELSGLLARKLTGLSQRVRDGAMQVALRQVRPYLMRKAMHRAVVVDFYHRSFWKAVRAKYLPDTSARHASHRDLADYFQAQDYWMESLEEQRKRVKPPCNARPANERKVVELPWQLLELAREAVTAGVDAQAQRAYDEIEHLFCDLPFLEAKNEAGMVFDLVTDFSAAVQQVPPDRPGRRILKLLEEAVRRDIHFIARHAGDYPQALFQCLWNSCWWYDCDEAAKHYVAPAEGWNEKNAPWLRPAKEKLSGLLEGWHAQKQEQVPGLTWLRSLRPPQMQLGSAQLAILRGHENWVESVAFSSDGARIVSGSMDKTVRVWDALTAHASEQICPPRADLNRRRGPCVGQDSSSFPQRPVRRVRAAQGGIHCRRRR